MRWLEFWDDFRTTIHELPDMSETRKFKYLRQALKDDALELIKGFPLSDANYHEALKLLQEQYGDPQVAIFSHFEALLSIPEASHEIDKLRSVYNQCESHVRSLVALGLKEDMFGQVFVPILLSKMPKYVRVELHRRNGSTKWSLARLRELMKEEIDARDRADRSFMKPKSESKPSEHRAKGSWAKGAPRSSSAALVSSSVESNKQRVQQCSFCGAEHRSEDCAVYPDCEARMGQIRNLCRSCLGRNHKANECYRKYPCYHCRVKGHHRSLCPHKYGKKAENTAFVGTDSTDDSEVEESQSHDTVNAVSVHDKGYKSIMQTAQGCVRGLRGKAVARFVFDTASSRSFITKAKADEIGAKYVGEEVVSLGRFRENRRVTVKYKIVEIEAVSPTGETKVMRLAATDVITTPIQLFPLDSDTRKRVRHLKLAEPLVDAPVFVKVDILVGLDWYFEFVEGPQIRIPDGMVFMESFFGYVGGGRVGHSSGFDKSESNLFTVVTRNPVENFELEKFWSLEDLGIKDNPANNEDELALQKFKESLEFKDSRYYVKWPFKDNISEIPSNFGLAVGRLRSLLRRLSNDPDVVQKYEKTFRDQFNADIIEVAPRVPTGIEHYIPHQCVIKTSSNTTKFRIVMDASARSTKQTRSINECFYHCPLILSDLVGILLRFRRWAVAFVADIEKAYLQIGLQESERDCTRFLWVKDARKPVEPNNLVIYRFKRVPFGFSPSAFLLGGSVDDLLIRESTEVASEIRENIFVDNVFGGKETVTEATDFAAAAIRIFQTASMNLREWQSNSKQVVKAVDESRQASGTSAKVLGLKWDTVSDTLSCPIGFSEDTVVQTKRQALKALATVFDPCGYFAPLTVHAKILMQQLWTRKIEWDAEMPSDLADQWKKCSTSILQIPTVKLNRQFRASVYDKTVQVEMHCFCDASSKAYAAAVYVRLRTLHGTYSHLLICKSRVNPVKQLAIPRLELMAALIGSRLISFVEREFRVLLARKVLWSDSKCTLHWIRGKQTYTKFVENRLREIRSVHGLEFRYVPTKQNPADLPSRGTTMEMLRHAAVWWYGPEFLQTEEGSWPVDDISSPGSSEEVRSEEGTLDDSNESSVALVAPEVEQPPHLLFNPKDYSSLRKLLGVTAFVFRFVRRTRHAVSGPLTAAELDQAKSFWIKQSQLELQKLMSAKLASFANMRQQLGLFWDEDGFVRCRGRLQNSDLAYDSRNPILLPKDSYFTILVIKDCHAQLFHAGAQHTLAKIREKFWIPHGRSVVRSVLSDCTLCRKHHGGPYRMPDPPPLPPFRVSRTRPFSHTGLEYLGPLFVLGDGMPRKVWVCLFTCASVRAIHLEVVASLNTVDFLLCLRRFMALYGVPDVTVSDNAKQFHLADKISTRMWSDARKSREVREFVASKGMQWLFITELAPWMGGFYERLVSPVKSALKKCLNRKCVSQTELETVVYEVARVVNTRPLIQVENEVGYTTLTPAHFLLRDSSYVPNGAAATKPSVTAHAAIRDWKRALKLIDSFWETWRRQYLAELRSRLWAHHQRNTSRQQPKVGAIVQLAEKLPRGVWRLGRVVDVREGADGKIRSARVRLANGNELTRSIKFLHPLEFDDANVGGTQPQVAAVALGNETLTSLSNE